MNIRTKEWKVRMRAARCVSNEETIGYGGASFFLIIVTTVPKRPRRFSLLNSPKQRTKSS